MFHRVKTDDNGTQKNNDTSRIELEKASEKAQTHLKQTIKPTAKMQSYLQVLNEKNEIKESPEPEMKTHTNPQTVQQKEKKTMSQTPETKTEPTQNAQTQTAPSPYRQAPTGNKGYTPAYASPYAQVTNTPAANTGQSTNDRKLTIGHGITMSGEINSCDHLYVEGTVEAALKGAQMLDVAETGVFYGSVEIEEATISGRFEGEMNVTGRLTIESTGIVTGTISYGEIQLEAGATVDGRMTPINAPQQTQQQHTTRGANEQDAPQQNTTGEAVLFEKQNVRKETAAAE